MFFARIEADFAAAHQLVHYHGKCERLHGHNYRVRVWVQGEKLDQGGMLVDFGILKQALAGVLSKLDHLNLNDNPYFADDPSAERIALFIFENLKQDNPDLPIAAVDVFESNSSMARYCPGGSIPGF
ncbi:MAG: 6-carboxytetrahydropterin synthase QueD [Spirochaetaceae bacterium]|nr:6-carboxytetrahydropterin synthase QueD [Spirochaetaceae bacterium]